MPYRIEMQKHRDGEWQHLATYKRQANAYRWWEVRTKQHRSLRYQNPAHWCKHRMVKRMPDNPVDKLLEMEHLI